MTEPAAGNAAPEPVTETWTYGGIRADKDGKKWHAWIDPAGEEHWFARTGSARMAVGSHYTAQVTRRDGEAITLHGTPGRGHRQPVVGHHRREPGAVRHPGRPRQPGGRDRLPALHQRAARHQPSR